MTETRCFHCKLDVAPVDEDGCCNNCGADLGCTCATEADTGNHTNDCVLSIREERDRFRHLWELELSRASKAEGEGFFDRLYMVRYRMALEAITNMEDKRNPVDVALEALSSPPQASEGEKS